MVTKYKEITWNQAIKRKPWLKQVTITFILGMTFILLTPGFMHFIQNRPGRLLQDHLLSTFSPIDVSFLLFAVIYSLILMAILYFIRKPALFLIAAQSYLMLLALRMLCIYLVPLEPPTHMLVLSDPLIDGFLGYSGTPITKDLFFSGHTATSFLLFLLMENKYLRPIFGVGCLAVAVMVLLQHVHYTIDVLAAPIFAFASYRLVVEWQRFASIK